MLTKENESDMNQDTQYLVNSTISTFMYQDSLPRLPIPPLDKTLDRFSKTIQPLLFTQRQREEAARAIENFKSDEGPVLQKLLEEYDNGGTGDSSGVNSGVSPIGSYIEEFWSDAYLAPDTSVVLNLNPFLLLEEGPDAKLAKDQILRAASLTFHTLKFAAALKNETVPPDTFHGEHLCMDQFRALFGSCRIPKAGQKDVVEVDPESSHVAVLFRNQFYYFRGLWPAVVEEGSTGDDGAIEALDPAVAVNQADIAQILRLIVENGSQTSVEDSNAIALGALTTLPRKSWAKAREMLIQTSEHNSTALAIVDSALFVLVLDDFVPKNINEAAANILHGTHIMSPSSASIQSRDSEEGIAIPEASLTKEYQSGTCCNRWYDKLQIIVCSDGSAGVNFEQSAIDCHTASRFASDVFAETVVTFAKSITKPIYTNECPIPSIIDSKLIRAALLDGHESGGKPLLDTSPKKLMFNITEEMKVKIFYAETSLGDALYSDDTYVLEFQDFGKNLIIENKLSPDSFVQMSILLAYFSLYGEIVCAYEPVLTKRFFHGRTEGMRPTTVKVVELCNIWKNRGSSDEYKLNALIQATQYHNRIVNESSHGEGVDRHLYALKCIAEKNNLPVPEFFKSKAWEALNHTVISTASCGNPAIRLFGFAPAVPDGFGIGYIIKDNGIQYSISSKHRQTRRYAKRLQQILREIGRLLKPSSSHTMGYHGDSLLQKAQRSKGESAMKKNPTKKKAKRYGRRRTTGAPSFVGRIRKQSSVNTGMMDKTGSKLRGQSGGKKPPFKLYK